ncbi:L-lactate permease [Halobiforma lacisalsi AJ5]|uniref:L-lactate permease n=1 Tax=Natronobacterium lacisalsi AJ5 TaxID=358396 RepID=M0LHD8_NATLA|nr:L-lactate permease [Halobiforma lacisalsi]EMA31854.1 L-lactate permease [Halobiforma lacisalsi AJ5]
MVSGTEVLFAAVPLIVVGVLLVGLLWPATRAMPIAWLSAVVVAAAVWGMPPSWLAAATVEGIITAIQILWIVFGALVLLYTMMIAGAFDALNRSFATVSEDRRVQIVLVAFFLATFLEGVAGFGTPAAVVAPLLLGLGFPALAAVVAALIGHIIAVTYGAVGTPIIVGIREPIDSVFLIRTTLEAEGVTPAEFAVNVAAWAATYHLLVGVLMPFIAVAMVVYFFGERRSIRPALEVAPLCLFAGVAFGLPYWFAAWYVTPEFPSLIGSMVGATVVVGTLRAGYLLPDEEWTFPDQSEWPDHWLGEIQPGDRGSVLPSEPRTTLYRAWTPYLLLLVLLVATRLIEPLSALLQGETVMAFGRELSLTLATISTGIGRFTVGLLSLQWVDIFGTTLENDIDLGYVPGMWLLVSAVAAGVLFDIDRSEAATAVLEAARKLVTPLIALVFVLAMAHVMLQSAAHPGAPDQSMIVVLAVATANVFGPAYPFVAALIGAFGAALVGSNTVSNITFGPLQFVAAENLAISRELTVGAQAVGGAIGNLVAIHNVVAALATVGLVGEEGRVIRLNLIPLVYYTVFVGFWTVVFVYVLFPDVF